MRRESVSERFALVAVESPTTPLRYLTHPVQGHWQMGGWLRPTAPVLNQSNDARRNRHRDKSARAGRVRRPVTARTYSRVSPAAHQAVTGGVE